MVGQGRIGSGGSEDDEEVDEGVAAGHGKLRRPRLHYQD